MWCAFVGSSLSASALLPLLGPMAGSADCSRATSLSDARREQFISSGQLLDASRCDVCPVPSARNPECLCARIFFVFSPWGSSRSGLRALLLKVARQNICNRAGSAATRRAVHPVPSARNSVFPVRVFMLCVLGLYCSVRSSAIYAASLSFARREQFIRYVVRRLMVVMRHCSLCNSKSIFSFVCCAFVSASVQTELLTSSKAGIPSTTESMLS